jgi:hypothetical protein
MSKDPGASRKAEQRDNEKSGLISIKPVKIESGVKKSGGGFKKGGFKSAFAPSSSSSATVAASTSIAPIGNVKQDISSSSKDSDDDVDYEYYDPRRPTDCEGGCGFHT